MELSSASFEHESSAHRLNENGSTQDNERRTRKRLKYRRKLCSEGTGKDDLDLSGQDYLETSDNRLRHRCTANKTNGTTNGSTASLSHYSPESVDRRLQLIIIGDRSVGKTSFLDRFTSDTFQDDPHPTVGIDFKKKVVSVGGLRIRLQIWDTAGQERFDSITTAYYRCASGVLLIYDVTKPESYSNLTKWLQLVQQYAPSGAEVALIGNKADLSGVKVNTKEARNFAEKCGYLFYEASAKENLNVDAAFNTLIYKILKQIPEPHERNPRVLRKVDITIHQSNEVIAIKKKSCC